MVGRGARLRALLRAAACRQAVRITTAAMLAYLGTMALGLPEGYWAVITCLVVVQGSLGATLSAGIARANGTIIGALLGGAGAWAHARLGVPVAAVLAALVLPLSALAALDPRFRLAPMTAALLLLAIPSGSGAFSVALHRIAEIVLGGVIGGLTALLVFPERGVAGVRAHGAAALSILGDIMRLHATQAGSAEELSARLQTHIGGMETAHAEAMQERQFRLSGEPASAPLVRTLRRLRTDVAMLGRTIAEQPGTEQEHAAFADPIAGWFQAASRALGQGEIAPDLATVDGAGAILRQGTSLQLVHTVLRRDLGDLADRITEHSRGAAAGRRIGRSGPGGG